MNPDDRHPRPLRWITAAGIVGALLGSFGVAAALSGDSSPTTGTPVATDQAQHHGFGVGETVVTGDAADKAKAAALKAVPGGTVESVTTETDRSGVAYEVHMTKPDGTRVTVLEDENFTVVDVRSCPNRHDNTNSSPQPAT
jgi:hypothetical protein